MTIIGGGDEEGGEETDDMKLFCFNECSRFEMDGLIFPLMMMK